MTIAMLLPFAFVVVVARTIRRPPLQLHVLDFGVATELEGISTLVGGGVGVCAWEFWSHRLAFLSFFETAT